jgi:hypothetical protein
METNDKEVRKRKNINERKSIRRPCKMPTDFSVENRAYMGIITDISPLGVFIKSLDIFQTGETVRMVIKSKKAIIKRTGIIKWSNQIGFGLQFVTA